MKTTIKKPLWYTVIMTLCSVVIALFFVSACDEIENPQEDELYLSAKVENAVKYSNIVAVKLMMRDGVAFEDVELARGDWKDGGFTITLPKIDRKKYREFVKYRMLPITIIENSTTITISNKNARSGSAWFLGVDKDDNVVTRFFPHTIDENGNAARVSFSYVNSDVSIFGYIEAGTYVEDFDEYINANIMWLWENFTIYSIECKEGWNVSSGSSSQSPEGTIINKNSTIPINSSLKWYGGESWTKLD